MSQEDPALTPTHQPVELSPLASDDPLGPPLPAPAMAALAGVRTQVQVLAGQAQTTVGELLNLREGALMQLDKAVNAPLDIVVGDTVIARGELVAIGDYFGVRVTQVAGKAPS